MKTEKECEKEGEGYSGSEDSDSNQHEIQGVKIPIERRSYYEPTEKYRKTLRLSSEQIVSFSISSTLILKFRKIQTAVTNKHSNLK